MKCTACAGILDLPTIHFFCKHSYHQRCLGENEKICPKCMPETLLLKEKRRQQEEISLRHDQFFDQLKLADDGFRVITDYLGKNVFSSPFLKSSQ